MLLENNKLSLEYTEDDRIDILKIEDLREYLLTN